MSKWRDQLVKGDLITVEVQGMKFSFKEWDTAKDARVSADCSIIKDGKRDVDMSVYHKELLLSLEEVPYDKEDIKEFIGEDKEWKDLDRDQKWAFIGKQNKHLSAELVDAMEQAQNRGDATKKG